MTPPLRFHTTAPHHWAAGYQPGRWCCAEHSLGTGAVDFLRDASYAPIDGAGTGGAG